MRDDLDPPQENKTCTKCMEPWSRGHDCIYPLGGATAPDAPSAITIALEVLEQIHAWATLDRVGKLYPWIAARTAEALKALDAAS